MPVGPLAVHDEVSLELSAKIHKQTQADLGDRYTGPSAIAVALKFAEELDRKGKKHGKGFYEYPKEGKKFLWPGSRQSIPPAAQQPDVDEVKKRLLYVQAVETVRCLEEGVVTEPADADIGSILGWGYPAWTGGTLSFVETVGLKAFVAECDRLAAAYGPRFEVPARCANGPRRGRPSTRRQPPASAARPPEPWNADSSNPSTTCSATRCAASSRRRSSPTGTAGTRRARWTGRSTARAASRACC